MQCLHASTAIFSFVAIACVDFNRDTHTDPSRRFPMKIRNPSVLIRTVDLDHQQLLVIEDQPGTRIRVLFGGIWLTEEGRAQDRTATAGQELDVQAVGRTVIESIGRTRAQVVRPVRQAVAWWRAVATRQGGSVRALASRAVAAALAVVLSVGMAELLGRGTHQVEPGGHAEVVSRGGAPAAPG
jgi:Protein of unknown function (DUF2917)